MLETQGADCRGLGGTGPPQKGLASMTCGPMYPSSVHRYKAPRLARDLLFLALPRTSCKFMVRSEMRWLQGTQLPSPLRFSTSSSLVPSPFPPPVLWDGAWMMMKRCDWALPRRAATAGAASAIHAWRFRSQRCRITTTMPDKAGGVIH